MPLPELHRPVALVRARAFAEVCVEGVGLVHLVLLVADRGEGDVAQAAPGGVVDGFVALGGGDLVLVVAESDERVGLQAHGDVRDRFRLALQRGARSRVLGVATHVAGSDDADTLRLLVLARPQEEQDSGDGDRDDHDHADEAATGVGCVLTHGALLRALRRRHQAPSAIAAKAATIAMGSRYSALRDVPAGR